MTPPSLKKDRAGVLLIDAQPYFWNVMHGPQEPVLVHVEHLLHLATWLDLPLIATFEARLGETPQQLPDRLERAFPSHGLGLTKHTYDCCSEPIILDALKKTGRTQWLVAGAETDVCVLQSVLGLLREGWTPFVLEDALFTSEPTPRAALERMYQAGAVPCTLKTSAYELAATVDETPWLDHPWKPFDGFPPDFRPPESWPQNG